jgi:uncharacterized protein
MSHYALVLEIKKMLRNMDGWLDKAVAYAATKKFDANTLLDARLAPDMLPLRFQIQAACDHGKFSAARTGGKEAPKHADDQKTIEEYKTRIASVVEFLDTFSEKDFEGIADRTFASPRWEGKSMTAPNYLVENAIPNFFFHISMVYALLRHNGVDVGKRDFLGQQTFKA